MLEWNFEEAKVAWYEDGFVRGYMQGYVEMYELRRKLGIVQDCEEDIEQVREIALEKAQKEILEKGGLEKAMLKIAKKKLAEGSSIQSIHIMTGLDTDTIESLN